MGSKRENHRAATGMRARSAAIVAVAVTTCMTAPRSSETQDIPGGDARAGLLEEIRRTMAELEQRPSRPEDPSVLAEPDPVEPDADAPIVRMRTLVEKFDELLASQGARRRPGAAPGSAPIAPPLVSPLRGARQQTQEALRAFMAADSSPEDTLAHLAAAARELERGTVPAGQPFRRLLEGLKTDLVLVSRRMALDVVQLAEDVGVDGRRLSAIWDAMDEADQLLLAGAHADAADTYGDSYSAAAGTVQFDEDLFEANIRQTFNPQTIGYSYAIGNQGHFSRSGAGGFFLGIGFARTANDPPVTVQSPSKPVNIASVSKPMTAVAVLRVMHENGIPVDTSITGYLPPSWWPGPNIGDLTFRDLFTHRSGLDKNLNRDYSYASLRAYVEAGIDPADKLLKCRDEKDDEPDPGSCYQNANFALLARVLLPMMLGLDPEVAFDTGDPAFNAAVIYFAYMKHVLLQPNGVVGTCWLTDPTPTLFYRHPADEDPGIETGDWTLICGSGGWFMTAEHLLAFFAHARYNDATMPPAARQQMNEEFLGWQNNSHANGVFGTYHNHGGLLRYGDPPRQGLDACFMSFPLRQASLLINSLGHSTRPCPALKAAYEGAYVPN
jgi:hypothetical protein